MRCQRSSGPNLNKNSIKLSDLVPYYKNYGKLYFDTKRLKIGLNSVGEICGTLFLRKLFFLVNIYWCPNFLDYALLCLSSLSFSPISFTSILSLFFPSLLNLRLHLNFFLHCHNFVNIRRKLFDKMKLLDETLLQLNRKHYVL